MVCSFSHIYRNRFGRICHIFYREIFSHLIRRHGSTCIRHRNRKICCHIICSGISRHGHFFHRLVVCIRGIQCHITQKTILTVHISGACFIVTPAKKCTGLFHRCRQIFQNGSCLVLLLCYCDHLICLLRILLRDSSAICLICNVVRCILKCNVKSQVICIITCIVRFVQNVAVIFLLLMALIFRKTCDNRTIFQCRTTLRISQFICKTM